MNSEIRTGRWSQQEHELFIQAVALHGRRWIKVAEHVGTRTTIQVRSHAQKFELKKGTKAHESSEVMNSRRSYSCGGRIEAQADKATDEEKTNSWTSVAFGDDAEWSAEVAAVNKQIRERSMSPDASKNVIGAMGDSMSTDNGMNEDVEDEWSGFSYSPEELIDMQEAASDAAMMLDEDGSASVLTPPPPPVVAPTVQPVVYQDSRGQMGQMGQLGEGGKGGAGATGHRAKICRRQSSTLIDELMDFIEDDIPLDMLAEENFYKMEE